MSAWAERSAAGFFGLAVLALVVSPAFRDPPRDSFPLSDFPMFSRGRPSTELWVHHALGVTLASERIPLPPLVSADTLEVLQSMTVLGQAVESGRARTGEVCRAAAERVSRSGDDALRGVVAVEIATSRYDVIRYFEQGPAPDERRLHFRCRVPGR